MNLEIGIASDHGGKILKDKIARFLKEHSYSVKDFGVAVDSTASVDYPDYASTLSSKISSGELKRGILVCGSGIGMSIAANKHAGVRAALITDEYTARMSRLHNDANVLCLGERVLNHDRALDIVKAWVETEFEGGRHQSRLDKIRALETK
ncbi:MAG: ribose 5-phosphate isomerase B [Proteobacteria bacterium]|nr:MAG: ribose 5-phosphate isomerase B [Pseudomonadota bacterium]